MQYGKNNDGPPILEFWKHIRGALCAHVACVHCAHAFHRKVGQVERNQKRFLGCWYVLDIRYKMKI